MPDWTYLDDIQANIIKPHGREFCTYLFFTFRRRGSRESARNFLNGLATEVTSHTQQIKETLAYRKSRENKGSYIPKVVVNAGLSSAGFKRLKTKNKHLPFDSAFRDGMLEADHRLHDYGIRREENFSGSLSVMAGGKHTGISGFISFAADNKKSIRNKASKIRKSKWFREATFKSGIFYEHGFRGHKSDTDGPGRIGPLGFLDGVSEKRSYEEAARVALVKEQGHYMTDRKDYKVYPLGSYLVFRKIGVNKDAFNEMTEQLSKELDDAPPGYDNKELAAAMFMGRFRDGSPLVLTDKMVSCADRRHAINSTPFDYSTDRVGRKCPLHAHIRVMNDRKNGPQAARVVRRGLNYGKDPSKPEGILFVSYQASIINQFEPLFDAMVEKGRMDPIGYSGLDLSVQSYPKQYGSSKLTGPIYAKGRSLTSFKGGEYFYVPSISFLKKTSW